VHSPLPIFPFLPYSSLLDFRSNCIRSGNTAPPFIAGKFFGQFFPLRINRSESEEVETYANTISNYLKIAGQRKGFLWKQNHRNKGVKKSMSIVCSMI